MSLLRFTQPLIESRLLRHDRPHEITLGQESFILVRSEKGVFSFPSRCPHRGTKMVHGRWRSSRQVLECPYHGWTLQTGGQVRDTAGHARADCGFSPLQLTEAYGFVWIQGEDPIPMHKDTALSLMASFSIELSAPFHVVLDNFNEGSHTPFVHRVTGPYPSEIESVKFDWKAHGDRVDISYFGPQKRNLFFPGKHTQWSIRWSTFFKPVYMEYDSVWSDARTGRVVHFPIKHYYYLAPLGENRTVIHAVALADLRGWRKFFAPVFRFLVDRLTRNQVVEDEVFYAKIRDLPQNTAGEHLDKYDLPLVQIRKLTLRDYLGKAPQSGPGSDPGK